MTINRVIVTLPSEVVQEIERGDENRSRFVLDTEKRELMRRRREELRRSLRASHPESLRLAEAGIDEWAKAFPDEAAAELVDPRKGTAVRWVPGRGWGESRA